MFCRSLLPVVFLAINFDSDARNEVEAGAHELVPFRSSWYGSVEKTRLVEETTDYEVKKEVFAEFANRKPRKLKTKETFTKRTDNILKKSHVAAKKKKKKKKRKSKKKPAPSPRRFIKTTEKQEETEREKESNFTDSIEVTKKTKPVDIIVHIKVSE